MHCTLIISPVFRRLLVPNKDGTCQKDTDRSLPSQRRGSAVGQDTLINVHKSSVKSALREIVDVAFCLWTRWQAVGRDLIYSFNVGAVVSRHSGSILLARSTRVAFLIIDGDTTSRQCRIARLLSGNCRLWCVGKLVADSVSLDGVVNSSLVHIGAGTPNGQINHTVVQTFCNYVFRGIIRHVTNASGGATKQLLPKARHANAVLRQPFHYGLTLASVVGIGNILVPERQRMNEL
jgi:hypothetical protein